MSLTPEQIEQELIRYAISQREGELIDEWSVWLACAESKQAETDALNARIAELEEEKQADTALMQSLTARIRELEKDAARYRWMREPDTDYRTLTWLAGAGLDSAIDKAMESKV